MRGVRGVVPPEDSVLASARYDGALCHRALASTAVEEDVERYLGEATNSFGMIDFHHLNAGIPGSAGGFPDLSAADFDRVMAVNVRGIFLGLRGAFRCYRMQESAGSVVLTASIASLRGSADLIAYQTPKHAVLGLLHGAAMYGGPLGIRVNAVAPGIVPTALFTPAGRTWCGGPRPRRCAALGRRTRSRRPSRSCCPRRLPT
jgi:NAD(P)-dependent dehydrogenase (short-subunit alcohol dehydrogenase family)